METVFSATETSWTVISGSWEGVLCSAEDAVRLHSGPCRAVQIRSYIHGPQKLDLVLMD
jgi:hypothetical protein